MSRPPRPDEPGMFHHVTLRGVAAMDVFVDDVDRRRFVSLARSYVRDGGGLCYAWALMTNHVHLVLRTGHRPLSEVVHGFAFRYAQSFNWRHGRPGHLFQRRFGSAEIDSEDYLRTAIAYVHLNPLRAGIVRTIDDLTSYRWTSYAGLMGTRAEPLAAGHHTLALFHDTLTGARASLVELTRCCLARGEADPTWDWTSGLDVVPAAQRIDVGAMLALRSDELARARDEREMAKLRAVRLGRDGWTVDAVIAAVCTVQRVPPAKLMSVCRARAVSEARALVAHLAITELLASRAEVARRLDLSETATQRAADRGVRIARARGLQLGDGLLTRVRVA